MSFTHKFLITFLGLFVVSGCSYVVTIDYSEPSAKRGIINSSSVRVVEHATNPFREITNSIKIVEKGVSIDISIRHVGHANWTGPLVFPIIPVGLLFDHNKKLALDIQVSGILSEYDSNSFIVIHDNREIIPSSVKERNGIFELKYDMWPWDFELYIKDIFVEKEEVVFPKIMFTHKNIHKFGLIP